MDPLRAAAPYLAYGFLTLVHRTSRLQWRGLEHLDAVRRNGSFIYAFWHQRQVAFTFTHQGSPVPILVSRSRDGEIIAKTMALFAIPAVRGSSSRGASASAKEMLDLLASGTCVGITPDGPKGPARKVKEGAVYLAQKSGRPILPITNAASRKLTFEKAWDRFQVPLPFSRLCVAHGAPVRVGAGDDLSAKALELERVLDAITEEADAAVR